MISLESDDMHLEFQREFVDESLDGFPLRALANDQHLIFFTFR